MTYGTTETAGQRDAMRQRPISHILKGEDKLS